MKKLIFRSFLAVIATSSAAKAAPCVSEQVYFKLDDYIISEQSPIYSLDLCLGTVVVLDLPGNVRTVALGDDNIAKLNVMDQKTLLVTATSEGWTNLLIFFEDKVEPMPLNLKIEPDADGAITSNQFEQVETNAVQNQETANSSFINNSDTIYETESPNKVQTGFDLDKMSPDIRKLIVVYRGNQLTIQSCDQKCNLSDLGAIND